MIYQTIITNRKNEDWEKLIEELKENGILWVISEDEDKRKTFELIEELSSKGLKLKNIILWVNKFEDVDPLITNLYKSILFFVKSEDYFFDKDPIREKHIWKDVEWGRRNKNYNPKGKDPSNVWINAIDDNKGKIIRFRTLTQEEIIERCILCSTKKDDKVLIKVSPFKGKLSLNRKIKNE